jgi:uncharacterized protein
MIAAAMTTRKSGPPTYTDLAKARATITRDIAPDRCTRLTDMVAELQAVDTQLRFHMDENGHRCVAGQATAHAQLSCQLCGEPVPLQVHAQCEGVLVSSELEARELRDEVLGKAAIIVSSQELNEVELVEDELLLQLPTQVCVDIDCERRPSMDYGPLPEGAASDTYRPFAGLAERLGED